jgi:hypothetical protein
MAEPLNPSLALQRVMESSAALARSVESLDMREATALETTLAHQILALAGDVVRLNDVLQTRDMEVAMLLEQEMQELRGQQDDNPEPGV